jgi:hypothetical protein
MLGDIQRRAVTRRASRIFAPEPGLCKQEGAKSGQTCVEQFELVARTSSRSPLAKAATSPAFTSGAKLGSAIAEAPRNVNIARAERDLTIWALLTCCLGPSTCWDQAVNNLNENKFHDRNLYMWPFSSEFGSMA